MDNLPNRLRALAQGQHDDPSAADEAADEIERLREIMGDCGNRAHNLSCLLHYRYRELEDQADELSAIASLLWDLRPDRTKPGPPSVEKKIKEEARAYKIGAIKMARNEFGMNLKDAKEYVERLQEDAGYER